MKSLYTVISESILDDDYADNITHEAAMQMLKPIFQGKDCYMNWDPKTQIITAMRSLLVIALDQGKPVIIGSDNNPHDISILNNINVECCIVRIQADVIKHSNFKLSDLPVAGTKWAVLEIDQPRKQYVTPAELNKFIDCDPTDRKFDALKLSVQSNDHTDMSPIVKLLQHSVVRKFERVYINIPGNDADLINVRTHNIFFGAKKLKAYELYVLNADVLSTRAGKSIQDVINLGLNPYVEEDIKELLINNPTTRFLFFTTLGWQRLELSHKDELRWIQKMYNEDWLKV